jgi:NADH dehydrogenase [ubiquinone] 1 alpha subcomplex assembly factor 5
MSDALLPEAMNLFDRRLLRQRRERAAQHLASHDFLIREAGERLADRLEDVRRKFPRALDLGCHGGQMAELLAGRGGIEHLVQCDLSPANSRRAGSGGSPALAADEEFLPFAEGSFDLILSCLDLHWVNDLPGALMQIRRVLKPDGLFLAVMLGLGTLAELRDCLIEAEEELTGGASPRVSPFADARDAAGLLQRAGFALPVADVETITATYADALALMRDLRGMGEANAARARSRRFAGRDLFARAAALYALRHGQADGRIPARFRLVFLTGWAPHESQQRAMRPGSAQSRLADALGTAERKTGERARPMLPLPGRRGEP